MTSKGPKGATTGTPVNVSDLKQKIDNMLSKRKKKELTTKDLEKLAKEYSMDELFALQNSALDDTTMSNDEIMTIVRNISNLLKTKKNVDTNISESEKKEKEEEHQKELEKTKEEKRLQEVEAERLKDELLGRETEIEEKNKELSEKDTKLSEKDKEMLEKNQEIDRLNEDNTKKLEELFEAKNKSTTDENKINGLKNDIIEIEKKRKRLEDQLMIGVPAYDKTEINKMKTRRIDGEWKFFDNTGARFRINLLPSVTFVKKLRTRSRLNKTIKKFNTIGKDAKWGLRYFLSKNLLTRGWKFGMGIKRMRNYFTMKNPIKLEEAFKKQKEMFLDDIKKEIKNPDENDKKAFKAIEERLDYYHRKYKKIKNDERNK